MAGYRGERVGTRGADHLQAQSIRGGFAEAVHVPITSGGLGRNHVFAAHHRAPECSGCHLVAVCEDKGHSARAGAHMGTAMLMLA